MIRTLLIISAAGAVLCAAAVGGAVALGGNDLARHGWSWTIRDDDGESVRFRRVEGDRDTPVVTRALDWTGGDSLTVEMPGDVTYVQGEQAGVSIEGPKTIVDRVRLTGGRLSLDDRGQEEVTVNWGRDGVRAWSDSDRLRITVTAPSVKTFALEGSGDLTIQGYDQPQLAVSVSGSGTVDARGRAGAVAIKVSGSGEANLSDMDVRDATVDLAGSGDVSVGPTEQASVRIDGSGDVTLTRRPARLEQDVSGSGDVIQD